jgi:3-hydroxybutyryl-CoA dehydratase
MTRWMEMWGMPQSSRVAVDAFDAWKKAWEGSLSVWAPGSLSSARAPREYAPGRSIDQLQVGQRATFTKLVTQADIDDFARVTGDDNPIHLDEAWAATSVFKGRISHGLLTAGLISATIGTQLPGPGTLYLSQSLRWTAPARPGDVLTCTVTVKELVPEKNRAVLTTIVTCEGKEILTGEALVMPPKAASE